MTKLSTAAFFFAFGLALPALAAGEQTPAGNPVVNQARQARAVVKSDSTVLTPTRALYIGDAAACNIAVLLSNDSAAVTFVNVQPGAFLPLMVKKVMSTNTNCATVLALY